MGTLKEGKQEVSGIERNNKEQNRQEKKDEEKL
jgi:hypothetical protein